MRRALVGLIALFLAGQSIAQAPALPRSVPSTAMPAVARTVRLTATSDLQAALDSAKAGDAIELPCPSSYTGNYVLRRASVIVRPACYASLSAGRITPAVVASLKLPKLCTAGAAPVVSTEANAHHYRLIGLEVTVCNTTGTYALIALGSDQQTTLAEIPDDLVLDRLYMHGTPTGTLRRCIALNSGSTAIIDSRCENAHENGGDSQAILGWTGPGPYLIQNNYLEAGHEVIMFGGGGDPLIVGLVPSDLTVVGNVLTRPAAWKDVWQVKNLFELKSASRVLVEHNILENTWISAQDGSAVVIKSTNQGSTCVWCGTQDVTVRWNWLNKVGAGFVLAEHPELYPVVPLARVSVTDNLITDVAATFSGSAIAFNVQGDIPDVEIARNTVVTTAALGSLVFKTLGSGLPRFRFTNNLVAAGMNYGIYGDNTGAGLASIRAYAPTGVVTGNLFAGANQMEMQYYAPMYPPGNRFVAQASALGFRADYSRAVADSAGVDVAKLTTMLAGVREGTSVPAVPPVPPAPPVLTTAQLRAALAALDRATSASGRESKATKAALVPVAVYVRALLAAVP